MKYSKVEIVNGITPPPSKTVAGTNANSFRSNGRFEMVPKLPRPFKLTLFRRLLAIFAKNLGHVNARLGLFTTRRIVVQYLQSHKMIQRLVHVEGNLGLILRGHNNIHTLTETEMTLSLLIYCPRGFMQNIIHSYATLF